MRCHCIALMSAEPFYTDRNNYIFSSILLSASHPTPICFALCWSSYLQVVKWVDRDELATLYFVDHTIFLLSEGIGCLNYELFLLWSNYLLFLIFTSNLTVEWGRTNAWEMSNDCESKGWRWPWEEVNTWPLCAFGMDSICLLWGKSSVSPSLWHGTFVAGELTWRQGVLSLCGGCVCEKWFITHPSETRGSLTLTGSCKGGSSSQGWLCLAIQLQNSWHLTTAGAAAEGGLRSHNPLLHRHLTAMLSLEVYGMGHGLHPGSGGSRRHWWWDSSFLLAGGVTVIGNQLIAIVDPLHRGFRCATAAAPAAQEIAESPPEVCIESIDDWIHWRVSPAKPHKDVEGGLADTEWLPVRVLLEAGLAERQQAVQQEEGQPAANKDSHYDRKGLQHPGLLVQGTPQRGCGLLARSWPLPPCSLKGGDAADLGLGNSVDPGIGDDHYGHGDVEADKGGGDGVSAVQPDITAGCPR